MTTSTNHFHSTAPSGATGTTANATRTRFDQIAGDAIGQPRQRTGRPRRGEPRSNAARPGGSCLDTIAAGDDFDDEDHIRRGEN